MEYYATYIIGNFQYTPRQRRTDGMGWEPRYFNAKDVNEAAGIARSWYGANPLNPADKELWGHTAIDEPTDIILYSLQNNKRNFVCVAFQEIQNEV